MIEHIKRIVARRKNDDRGASAVEYALIMGLIVATLITIMATFGGRIADQFDNACKKVNSPANASCKV
jgi:pilus assembly protein Flp/PilA